MKNYIPAQNQNFAYYQSNKSDVIGNLWATMNIDLQSTQGVLKLSPRLKVNTSSVDDADLGLPVAFKYFDGYLWAICGTRIFKNSDGLQPNGAFTEDASTGAQTDYADGYSDMENFNSVLCATTTDGLYSLSAGSGGTWTSRDTLTASTNHVMTYFGKFDRLYYGDLSGIVRSIDTSWATADPGASFAIDVSGYVTCMKSNSSDIWLGTLEPTSIVPQQQGRIYRWDGFSSQVTETFKIDSPGCLSMCIKDNVPYVMDAYGRLLRYSGYGFSEIGRLPVTEKLLTGISSISNNRFIHPNGLIPTKNGTILALVNNLNNDNSGTINENFPSGIWEWSEEFGFVHKQSFTYNPVGSATITDFGQNRVSVVGALANVDYPSTNASRNGTIMAGATYYTNASSTASAIFIDDSNNTIQKKGYFVSNWFTSNGVTDTWNRIWEQHRRFLDSNDKIVFKYRLIEEAPVEATITWVDTTHFTTTTNITAYDPSTSPFKGTYGGEVEILQGTGSGSTAHITAISYSNPTYTVTIDTEITGVTTGTAKARFQKWIKLLPEVTGQVLQYGEMPIVENDTQIQVKCVLQFTGDGKFRKMALVSNENINTNN